MTESVGRFRVMVRMQIHPGMEQEFEQTWLEVSRYVTDHPANLGQWLSKSADGAYYIVTDWLDERQFLAYEQSEPHLAHRAELHPFRSAVSMTTMQVVYDIPGAARRSAMTSKVRVLIYARAPESDPAAVTDVYHKISRELSGAAGLVGNELLRSTSDARGFVIMSEWENMAAYRAWDERQDHREMTTPLRPLHDREPSVPFGVYEVTAAY
jgi:heme-degrading monooxygenase HmoA